MNSVDSWCSKMGGGTELDVSVWAVKATETTEREKEKCVGWRERRKGKCYDVCALV